MAKGNPNWAKKNTFAEREKEEKKEVIFVLKQSSTKKSTAQHTGFPVAYIIAKTGRALWKNPETGREEMRNIRHISGLESIWAHEQPKEYTDRDAKSITIENGILRVSSTEPRTLEYVRAIATTTGSFFEFDSEKRAVDFTVSDELVTSARHLVYEMFKTDEGIEAAKLYAKVLSIPFGGIAELKASLRMRADTNPELFIKDLSNPLLKKKARLMLAVNDDIIKIVANTIQYSNGNETIFTCDLNTDTLTAFTEHCENTEEGKALYKDIVKKIEEPLKA